MLNSTAMLSASAAFSTTATTTIVHLSCCRGSCFAHVRPLWLFASNRSCTELIFPSGSLTQACMLRLMPEVNSCVGYRSPRFSVQHIDSITVVVPEQQRANTQMLCQVLPCHGRDVKPQNYRQETTLCTLVRKLVCTDQTAV